MRAICAFILIMLAPGISIAGLEETERWEGGVIDRAIVREGRCSIRWAQGESPFLRLRFPKPRDWSAFSGLEFWLHSERATESDFMLIIGSENPATEGPDYYHLRIRLDWTGWRRFLVPFREMGKARDPIGWKKIDGPTFTASGFGNKPHPDAVLRLDGFRLVETVPEEGPLMTDEELFESLKLEAPELRAVKEAVERGDYERAKHELAKHIRERRCPRWFFDWRDHPFLGVKVPPPEADKTPKGWDYYHRLIQIDWQGWKRFRLRKEDFTPTRSPIGWSWIRYIAFNASGWGLEPDPETTLYFDDFRLVGEKGSVSICDFESGNPFEGLERTDEKAKSGRFSGKWENLPVNSSFRCWRIPHDWTDFDALEFWVYSEKATGARIILVLDSEPPKPDPKAEEYVRKRFTWRYGNRDWTVQFEDKIDWAANPTRGEARTHLWNEALNRHFHFSRLARAYWETGLERYAEALAEQWMDWIRSNPRPLASSGNSPQNGCYAWQTLSTGIRLESTWPEALYRCLGSPAFTDEVIVTILKSIAEQARHLMRWPTGGNWLTEESMGLFTAGMLFPEFREAEEWRRTAIKRLYRQLSEEVYPDGMEYELAAGYNNWVLSNMCNLLERAKMNRLEDEIPPDFKDKLEKMFDYLLYAMSPTGVLPGLNDSNNVDVRGMLMRGYKLFPHRMDLLFGATLGAKGEMPRKTSVAFPYTGHYVMRSSWDRDGLYLLFDSGPFGYGHQHEDKLHFVLWAYGRQLVLDPGNYSYDRSKWRRYITSSFAHNTVVVDGEGQSRRGKRETYVWPKPWDRPVPPGNYTVWISREGFDFVRGSYRDGYGPRGKIAVTHIRRILFLKPEYFIVQDTLIPGDEREHLYESLFHLDADEAAVDGDSLAVRTVREDANLIIVPLKDGLEVRVIKGQEEPVQGWAANPWRPIPTAIFSKRGRGAVRFAYVLYPFRGEEAPELRVEPLRLDPSGSPAIAVAVHLPGGRVDRILFNDSPGEEVVFEGMRTKAEAFCIRTDGEGRVISRFSTE